MTQLLSPPPEGLAIPVKETARGLKSFSGLPAYLQLAKNNANPSFRLYEDHLEYRVVFAVSRRYSEIAKAGVVRVGKTCGVRLIFHDSAFSFTAWTDRNSAYHVLKYVEARGVPLDETARVYLTQLVTERDGQTILSQPLAERPKNRWPLIFAAVVLGMIVIGGGIVALVMSIFRNSEPYEEAMAALQSNPAAVHELGAPVSAGYFVSGSIHGDSHSAGANFFIPVSGRNGSGTIHVRATQINDVWKMQELSLHIKGKPETIDLLKR